MGHRWSSDHGIYRGLLTYRSKTTDDRRLSQISIVFAYLDGCFRSGMESTTLLWIKSKNIEEMLDSLNTMLVDDLLTQVILLQKLAFLTDTHMPAIGPTFDGSPDVGGADADLILDGALIDFKSSSKCKLTSRILRQLIGYWLLDYSDCYALMRVAVYFTRHGAFWTIDISELLLLCGFESKLELRELWRETCRLRFEEAEKARRQRAQARKQAEEEAARANCKLSIARRKWRFAGASAMHASPQGLKKSKLKIIAELASGRTNYARMSPHERSWLDEDFDRAFMTFEDWQSRAKTS
jgi:hypothetical protein